MNTVNNNLLVHPKGKIIFGALSNCHFSIIVNKNKLWSNYFTGAVEKSPILHLDSTIIILHYRGTNNI